MGFYHVTAAKKSTPYKKGPSLEFLHRNQCKACPLNNQAGLKNPHMEPTGTDKPVVYILGEAPGASEDKLGKQFVGSSGRVLQKRIPHDWSDHIRWNNVVRTRPPSNRTPEFIEIECCRPSVIADIEKTKPKAIFGFGNIPLHWATGYSGVTDWNGRYLPVKIGNHTCWYFPMLHPSYVLRTRNSKFKQRGPYFSDTEFVFALNIKRAFEIVEDLPDPIVHTMDDALADIETVTGHGDKDLSKVLRFIRDCYDDKIVGFDYETNGLRPYADGAKILSVAMATKKKTMAFPIRHRESPWSEQQLEEIESALYDFFLHAKCRKVVHHLSFEQEWTGFFFGKETLRGGLWGCSLSQAYILDERQGQIRKNGPQSLNFLVKQYFGLDLKDISGLDRKRLDAAPLDKVLPYNGLDAKYHRLLYIEQMRRLKDEELMPQYKEHMRRVTTMVLTQLKGIPVHQKTVRKFYRLYTKRLKRIDEKLSKMKAVKKFNAKVGTEFSASNNNNVKYLVTQILGKPVEKVDEKELKPIKHPVVSQILKHRKASKLLSTYVLPLMPDSPHLYPDGRIHPIISTTKTVTWRTSSEDPNAQNYPKRQNREVRAQIKPGPNERVVSFDYSGIQARNVAMESLDKALIAAYWNRYDIHSDWLERILKHYPKFVPGGVKALSDKSLQKSFRHRAKNEFVFPSFFGAQANSIGRSLGIGPNLAKDLLDEFWDEFPSIKNWHESLRESYYTKGYVTGKTGIRRRAPISPNQLINAPIQADESMIVCDAMTRLSEIDHDKLQASMEIHDDLTFIWHKRDIDELSEIVINAMLSVPFKWAQVIPIGVEMEIGKDWANQERCGEFLSDIWKGEVPDWRKIEREAERKESL